MQAGLALIKWKSKFASECDKNVAAAAASEEKQVLLHFSEVFVETSLSNDFSVKTSSNKQTHGVENGTFVHFTNVHS